MCCLTNVKWSMYKEGMDIWSLVVELDLSWKSTSPKMDKIDQNYCVLENIGHVLGRVLNILNEFVSLFLYYYKHSQHLLKAL